MHGGVSEGNRPQPFSRAEPGRQDSRSSYPERLQESSSGLIREYMTPDPITITRKTTIAYAAHMMIWEGIELLPVIEEGRLIGVISRQDVIKAIQYMNNQPQMGETLEDVF